MSKPNLLDLVATWRITLPDGKKYKIQFEHGSTSGRRIIWINSKSVLRKDWVFRLVGKEEFRINDKTTGRIEISPSSTFSYEYSLYINNKPFEKFKKERSKNAVHWIYMDCRITLEKSLMQVLERFDKRF